MMPFKTQYDAHDRIHAPLGSRRKLLYAPKFDEDGRLELIESGTEDWYGYIQSHRDSVDLNLLLRRFANGETDVLSRRQGVFGDFTRFPSTYAELLNRVNDGKEYFDQLPIETKRQFGNSFSQWMASMDDSDFAQKMGWQVEEPAETPSTVNTEVSE